MKKMNLFVCVLYSMCLLGCAKDINDFDSAASLFGVVSDLTTGNPIANVSIDLREGLAWDCLGPSVGSTFTGTDGYFRINNINPKEDYFVIFRHSGYSAKGQRVVIAGKGTELNMIMTAQ